MDRGVKGGLYGEAHRFSVDGEIGRTLDRFEANLRRQGATHVLVTGLPLPRRSMIRLVVRFDWPDVRAGGHLLEVAASDGLIGGCFGRPRPFAIVAGRLVCDPVTASDVEAMGNLPFGPSDLLAAAGGDRAVVIVVPIHDFAPWQGCVIVAGPELAVGPAALDEFQYFCKAALRSLLRNGRVDVARPGDLSERERHVLRLTAIGKTAAEIADLLAISQRTVHAHLQNAGDKMNASNKTHTVIEALRYGQIRL